jgi:hypothetical protein
MLVMTVHAIIPVSEIDGRIIALMFFSCSVFGELFVSFWFSVQDYKSRIGNF